MSNIDTLDRPWHEHFGVPIVHYADFDSLAFDRSGTAVHVLDSAHGEFNIALYAQLESAQRALPAENELVVSLHGAATGSLRYPQFRRVQSLQNKAPNFLSFADPTLQYSDDSAFRIGWYVGGSDWDPLVDIAAIIRTAMKSRGCEHVAFVGSSAGGHAALRIATMFEGSLAFVMDPQSDIAKYYWPSRNRLFDHCWPGIDLDEAIRQSYAKTDLLRIYEESSLSNYIYYRQSTGDPWHTRVHAKPFEEAMTALTSRPSRDRYRFVYEAGEKEGHGKITAHEFDRHYEHAIQWWRESRAA